MILKKHQIKVVMPELHDIVNITIANEQGLIFALYRVTPAMMTSTYSKNEKLVGQPVMWCLDQDRTVMLYPRPDKDYNLRVEYLPPSKLL